MIFTITNLYPRPDEPTRGMFNAQLFREMAMVIGIQNPESRIQNICLVPEWRIWRWPAIRKWKAPMQGMDCREQESGKQQAESRGNTLYLPVFYLPLIGRSINWWFYCRAVRSQVRAGRRQTTDIGQETSKEGISREGAKGLVDMDASSVPRGPVRFPKSEVCGLMSDVSFLASWLYPDGVAVARALRGSGAQLWLMVLGSDTFHLKARLRKRMILDACAEVNGVVCVAQGLADRLVAAGVPPAKIKVVPNGVDGGLFRYRSREPGDSGKESGVGSPIVGKAQCILFIANLVPVKGPDVMLRAFAALQREEEAPKTPLVSSPEGDAGGVSQRSRIPSPFTGEGQGEGVLNCLVPAKSAQSVRITRHASLLLVIIGSGPMRRQLERQARELGIADKVRFLGSRPHAEVALWMNRADVLCLTSRSEGMPNVVAEALASGLPVVATDVGACREMLQDEPAARLCRREDVAGLTAALKEVLEMSVDRQAMAERYAGKYSWRRMADTIVHLINESGKV